MQNNKFQLLFKDKVYKIPTMFKHIIDIPLKISESLIFNPDHQYQVESNVSTEVFQAFINYMINDEQPDININNIHDFFKLSQEFQLFEDDIKKKMSQLGEYLVNLNGLHSKNISDVTFYEEQIAVKLDDYLLKYGKNLMNSPIQSLFNIFNHKKRKMTKHDLAYELIIDNFNSKNNYDVFVLLESIDGSMLSKSYLEDSIKNKEKRLNHMPTIQFSYLANVIETQNKLYSIIEELNNKLIQVKNQHEIDIKNLKEKNEKDKIEILKKNESDMKNLTEKFESNIKELIQKNEKDKNDLVLSFQNEIKKLNLKQSNEINELKKSNDSLMKKLKENEEEAKKKEENKGIDCSFKNDQLCGIISYLKKKYGDDLEKNGVLNLSDAKISSRYPMEHLFMYDSNHINDEYENQSTGVTGQSDGWFEIDFKEKKINLTSYTIRSNSNFPNGYCHPKSWRIVGSNDRTHWDVLNHQINNSSLNGRYLQNRFTCEDNHNYYRYIRYIQEDSWDKSFIYNICITCIELFGYIAIE